MTKQSSVLATLVNDALLNEWDPIGIKDIPEAADEYVGYAAEACQLITRSPDEKPLFDYLWWVETERIGLDGDKIRTKNFASELFKKAKGAA